MIWHAQPNERVQGEKSQVHGNEPTDGEAASEALYCPRGIEHVFDSNDQRPYHP